MVPTNKVASEPYYSFIRVIAIHVCICSILQTTFFEVIFLEIVLTPLGGQVAAQQLAAIDRTILLFELVDQFLSQGIAQFI